MAVTATPIFTQAPKHKFARIAAANTALDGTGTLVALFTAGANGSKVNEIVIQCEATSAAGYVTLFVDTAGDGTFRLVDTFLIAAVTMSTTVQPYRISRKYDDFILSPGDVVKCAKTVGTDATLVHVNYGDF
jgi:hypothetical protein